MIYVSIFIVSLHFLLHTTEVRDTDDPKKDKVSIEILIIENLMDLS